MKRVMGFLRKERLYLLLLAFVILINAFVLTSGGSGQKARARQAGEAALSGGMTRDPGAGLFMDQAEAERILSGRKDLAILFAVSSLLLFAALCLGIVIDALLISAKIAKRPIDIHTYRTRLTGWKIWDVGKVVILFLFFGYVLVLIESALIHLFPLLKSDNFRMVVNSSILDTLAVVFIVYFAVVEHKEKLIALGLSVKNFFRNVAYGIIGYIAVLPILMGTLMLIALVVQLTKYVPEKQPVVELFLKEEDTRFLLYTTFFTSLVGPLIEELFFRGFMYNAFKRRIGIAGAAVITSAVFASLHTNVVGFLPILVLGLLLTYLYEKTGTLISSMTVHVAHNMGMVFLVFLMKEIKL